MADDCARMQISWSTWPPPPTCSRKQRSRSTWPPYLRARTCVSFPSATRCNAIQLALTSHGRPGNHQMARQARLHPPPHRRRDQRSRRHKLGIITGPATRLGPRAKARMAHHARYALPLPPSLLLAPYIQPNPPLTFPSPEPQASAPTSAASRSAKRATSAAGSAPATARTTTSPGARGRAPRR